MEPGVARDLHRDGPGQPCMVRDREGCRQRIGGRPDPTRMIAASVTVTLELKPRTSWIYLPFDSRFGAHSGTQLDDLFYIMATQSVNPVHNFKANHTVLR